MFKTVDYTGFEIDNKDDLKAIRKKFDENPLFKDDFKLTVLVLSPYVFVEGGFDDDVIEEDEGKEDEGEDEEDEEYSETYKDDKDLTPSRLYFKYTRHLMEGNENNLTAFQEKELWDYFENHFEYCKDYVMFILFSKMKEINEFMIEYDQSFRHDKQADLSYHLMMKERKEFSGGPYFLPFKKFNILYNSNCIVQSFYKAKYCERCKVYDLIHCSICNKCIENIESKFHCMTVGKCVDKEEHHSSDCECRKIYKISNTEEGTRTVNTCIWTYH